MPIEEILSEEEKGWGIMKRIEAVREERRNASRKQATSGNRNGSGNGN